jgi:hypothetical protein
MFSVLIKAHFLRHCRMVVWFGLGGRHVFITSAQKGIDNDTEKTET